MYYDTSSIQPKCTARASRVRLIAPQNVRCRSDIAPLGKVPSHSKEVVSNLFTATDLLPSEPRDVYDSHHSRAIPALVHEEPAKLVLVEILVPIMGALGHDLEDVLRNQVRGEPAHPRPRDGAHDQPAPRFDKRLDLLQKGAGLVNVLNHLEHRHDVVALTLPFGHLELLDRAVPVLELPAEARVLARVRLGDGQDGRGRVDGEDAAGGAQAGGALGEDATSASDVQVREGFIAGFGLRVEARVYEIVT